MLRKERRRQRRLPILLDVELKAVSVHKNGVTNGNPIQTHITNVGPGGVMVSLPSEQPIGTRYWVTTRVNGKRVEFYAMVRHVSIDVTGPAPVYSHGLQITAAMASVMDEFDTVMKKFAKGDPTRAVRPVANSGFDSNTDGPRPGATLAN